MKKILFTILFIILILGTTACNINSSQNGTTTDSNTQTTSSSETTENIIQTEESTEVDGMITIQTKHFCIKVPQEWENTCTYETGDTWISFTHKNSVDYGGHLFTISLENTTYYSDVESEILGGLGIPNLGEFNVWVRYPSDIQFDMYNPNGYSECSSEIDNIISTISFNDGYYFSKTPYEIQREETPDHPAYEDNKEIEQNQQKYWPASANFSWHNLLNLGAKFECDANTDIWYAIVGNRVCYWISTEKEWLTEYELLFETYYLTSTDGIEYKLYKIIDGRRVWQLGFDRTLTADGSLIVK